MLERRKEESESMGKYQGLLMSSVVAAIIVFVAPSLIIVLTGGDVGDGEDSLFDPPVEQEWDKDAEEWKDKADGKSLLPNSISAGLKNMWTLLLWFVRLVLVAMILVSVLMLRINPKQNRTL